MFLRRTHKVQNLPLRSIPFLKVHESYRFACTELEEIDFVSLFLLYYFPQK